MLINTKLFIAFKCNECDHVQIFEIYIFWLLNKGNNILRCNCTNSYIKIIKINEDRFKLAVYCSKCEHTHMFLLSKRALINKEVFVLYCPNSKLELCLIGNNEEKLLNKLDKIEEDKENFVSKKLNLRNYFTNSKVMFESLGKINNIIKSGKLVCKCGSKDISVTMLKDKLVLKCRKCLAKKEIKAETNKDLILLLGKQGIFV